MTRVRGFKVMLLWCRGNITFSGRNLTFPFVKNHDCFRMVKIIMRGRYSRTFGVQMKLIKRNLDQPGQLKQVKMMWRRSSYTSVL